GSAWLGRGLVKIRLGRAREGRADLQVAATLEPQRALPRSYLGKAFSHTRDTARARKELAQAKKLDPNDPTSWLYSALLAEQQNRINEAVDDLERSKELNENRSLFRSRLLLDQDQAVRRANLAAIYRDAGMTEISAQEASRAVNDDYGNYSAHLFLANSYDALRDPKLINLRYETPWFSELLLANLLAPAGGGSLSQNISQQEYSRFFAGDHLGLFSSTEYRSRGDWLQRGSQYGVLGNTSYSFDAFYRTQNGERPNNDLEQLELSARFKQQITPQESILFEASYFDSESGDVAQYYYQRGKVPGVPSPSLGLRVRETQEPNVLFGYHREWSPGSRTLFLASRFEDTLKLKDPTAELLYFQTAVSPVSGLTNRSLRTAPFVSHLDYQSELAAYSAELQQIWQTAAHTLVAGGRYQAAWPEASSDLGRQTPFDPVPVTIVSQDVNTRLDRASVYGYENWQLCDQLRLIVGVSYDRLHYPQNIDTAPITDREATKDQVSPKAGLEWSPGKETHLRSYYAQSLGGVFFDNSVRLEPTQIAGF
ncbi:MAG TPA: TonB-dependent receptor, partial [Candidatus Binatia bacterium]|nr:TonB-dependent receptor [Candidatus Binatia bacterium]